MEEALQQRRRAQIAEPFHSSLWIDFTRTCSPVALQQFIAPCVLDPQAHLAEPVDVWQRAPSGPCWLASVPIATPSLR
jgi:hypothetical protein